MILEPGEASGPLSNEHPSSEQVLVVFEGAIEAEIDGQKFQMMSGDSAIVPKNAAHRFVNQSQERAITFSVYAPKAYD
jgi:mannose-6-phosphate isomerase-like protein (cupin superfamily)